MSRQHVVTVLVLAALAGSCGDPTKGGDMWAPLGYSSVPAAGAGAAKTICGKLADCGAFRVDIATSRGDNAAPVAYVVAAIEQAQKSEALDACVEQAEGIFEAVEERGVNVPWDGVATCISAAECSVFKSQEAMQRLVGDCAAQLGISIGSTTVKTPDQPPPPPVRRDAGVTIPDFRSAQPDSGVEPFPDAGDDADAW